MVMERVEPESQCESGFLCSIKNITLLGMGLGPKLLEQKT